MTKIKISNKVVEGGCQGKISEVTRHWRQHKRLDSSCMRGATYTINRKSYCITHAGKALLEMMAEEKEWVPAKK